MESLQERYLKSITRRQFFRNCGTGMGVIALASLMNENLFASEPSTQPFNPLAPHPSMFPASAKRVIYLHMAGAPSQLDLFDNKPRLIDLSGKPIPKDLV